MDIKELYQHYLTYPSICIDTRKLSANCIYFGLKGNNFDGSLFAAQALEGGAALCVVTSWEGAPDPRVIVVSDTLATLQALAKHHRDQLRIPIIGITGSNGKTTTKELLAAVLCTTFKTIATQGNLNNHIGVPLTLLSIPLDAEMAIIEMGANHIGEIASYCQYAQPNFAIINNCGKAHLEGFGSLEGVRKGKGELYDFIREHGGTIFINTDLDYLVEMSKGINNRFSYGQSNADIIGRDVSDTPLLTVAILNHLLECSIQTQLTGSYNLPNVLAAVAVGTYFEIPIDTIKAAIETYCPNNSRSQWVKTSKNQLILDAYNANPSSMEAAIQNFSEIPHAQKILLLGSMKEVGAASDIEHQKLIDQCKNLGFTEVYVVGPEFGQVALRGYQHFSDSDALSSYITTQNWEDKLILIKGSRGSKMELTTKVL